jgi:FtsZ-binding cell division protein ZapB
MNRLALACVITLACGSAAAAQTPVRIVPRAPAPSATPNPAVLVSPQDLAKIKVYDPVQEIAPLKKAVEALQGELTTLQGQTAALQAQVVALEAQNTSLKSQVNNQSKSIGTLSVADMNFTTDINALKASAALFKDHYHTVQDTVLSYFNKEVVSESHATGDDYITIGSVTDAKVVSRESSGPLPGPYNGN